MARRATWIGIGFLLVTGMILPIAAWAAGDAGTESPLLFGVEARAVGLGRAYTGVADDASAVFWNPAGLATLEKKEITTLYVPLYDAVQYGFVAFAYPVSQFGTLAAGLQGVSVQDIPKTSGTDEDLGTFTDLQLEMRVSYARFWWNRLAAGLNAKLYHHTLDTFNGTGIGLDLGVYFDAQDWVPGLTVGLAGINVVPPQVTLLNEPDVYPLNVRLGAAYRLDLDAAGDHHVTVAVEGEKPEFGGIKPHAGLEYQAFRVASLRAGWDTDHPTLGAGVQYWNIRLDYALALQPEFGSIHLFSMGWRFGPSLGEEETQRRQEILADLAQTKAREHNQKGLDFLRRGKFREAVSEFEKALSWVEESAEINANLSKAREALNTQTARQRYKDGETFYAKKYYVDALLAWKETAKLDPDYPGVAASIRQARTAMERQFSRDAEQTARRQSRNLKRAQDIFRAGVADYLDGRFQEAIQKWERSLQLDPGYAQAKTYLSKAQERLHQESAPAVVEDETPTMQESRRAAQLYDQGLLKYRQRKFSEAHELWSMVLKIDPQHKGAQRGLERIEAILKVFQERGVK